MRKILATAAMATLAAGALAVPASAGAPINGTGTLACSASGSAKIKPALTMAGSGPSATSVKATLSSCAGTGDGATIASGSAKGGSTSTTSTCTGLASGTTNMTLTTKWKGSVKLNATTVSYTTLTPDLTGTNVAFSLGGSVTAGSFNGEAVVTAATTGSTVADFLAACGGKGVKGFTITGGLSTIGI